MPHNRFFTDSELEKGQIIVLKGSEAKHMYVMRVQKEQEVELVNGKRQLAKATLINLNKNQADLRIKQVTTQVVDIQLILAQSLFKLNRLKWMVEKATELGVTDIWLFSSKMSEIKELKLQEKQKLQAHIISALKQCGRLDLPTIEIFDQIEGIPTFDGPQFFGDLSKDSPFILEAFNYYGFKKPNKTLIFIGPEKGFEKTEISFLEKRGVKKVRLSKNILRSETAAIAASALIHPQLKSASAR